MDHLNLADIWLYIIGFGFFALFLGILFLIYRKSEGKKKPLDYGRIIQTRVDGYRNELPNFGDHIPSYVSNWSFQEECSEEKNWRNHLDERNVCLECERLLDEEDKRAAEQCLLEMEKSGFGLMTAV